METKTANTQATKNLNRAAYVVFVILGICFMFVKDLSQAAIFWGLALVFDPFDQTVSYPKRPLYQKIWLIAHLGITAAAFGWMIAKDVL